jgi:polyhydroxyalkanoate synthesis regulator protein
MSSAQKSEPIVVKLYARCRLYDVENRRYISIEQLRRWTADRVAFIVFDAESGADLTRVLLS